MRQPGRVQVVVQHGLGAIAAGEPERSRPAGEQEVLARAEAARAVAPERVEPARVIEEPFRDRAPHHHARGRRQREALVGDLGERRVAEIVAGPPR